MVDRIRILTLNIYARRDGWTARRRVLQAGMAALSPDIVLFQEEVYAPPDDQAVEVLGAGWHIVHSAARSDAEASGVCVASRWPLHLLAKLDLTAGGRPVEEFRWTSLIVRVVTPPGDVIVANHFPDAAADAEGERERQAVLLARHLEEIAAAGDLPIVVAGDFDAGPDAASLRFLTGKQSLDGMSVSYLRAWDAAHPGESCVTLDPANPLVAARLGGWPYREIDHILVRTGFTPRSRLLVASCERAFAEPREGVYASDHYGVVADLRGMPG